MKFDIMTIGSATRDVFMAPAGFVSKDLVWRMYNIVNIVLFSAVVITVLIFRRKKKQIK